MEETFFFEEWQRKRLYSDGNYPRQNTLLAPALLNRRRHAAMSPQSSAPNNNADNGGGVSSTDTESTTGNTSLDSQLMMSLMERLQRYPSLLNTNSFLSQPLEDLILSLSDKEGEEEEDEDEDEEDRSERAHFRKRVAKEEAKLEKELVRIVHSGKIDSLKPNSGQAVTIGDAHICVGFHEESRQGYRVWEWHGHLLLHDEVEGFSPEYIYGNYFEKVSLDSKHSDDRSEEKDNSFVSSGLRELIDDGGGLKGRIVSRNLSASEKR